MNQNKLWTYDFTVITIGSFISMVGSTLASFSISLVVLDYTGSTFLYMIFHVCYQLPMVVTPLLAGPYLDRMSRKKMIYTLDYASAGIFALMYLLLQSGWMNYALLLGGSVALGAINGVYTVAYDSFYPNLISGECPAGLLGVQHALAYRGHDHAGGGGHLRSAGQRRTCICSQRGLLLRRRLL